MFECKLKKILNAKLDYNWVYLECGPEYVDKCKEINSLLPCILYLSKLFECVLKKFE